MAGTEGITAAQGWVIYQPLIVGLGAVVLASLGNTLLEWFRQYLSHSREAGIVRRAFLSEMKFHRDMFDGAISAEQRTDTKSDVLVPIDRFMPAHDNMLAKIGVLEPDEVDAVILAYSHMVLLPKNLGIIGTLQKDEFSSWIVVPSDRKFLIDSLHKKIVVQLNQAISVLSKH